MTSEMMGEILKQLLADHSFELPMHFALIARNGEMMAGHYHPNDEGGGLICSIEFEPKKGSAFAIPINMMFTDSEGHAARVVLGPDGSPDIQAN